MSSQFRGTARGRGKPVSQLGTKRTGLLTTARGWDFGVDVEMAYDPKTDADYAIITLNGGSGNAGHKHTLGTFTVDDLGA